MKYILLFILVILTNVLMGQIEWSAGFIYNQPQFQVDIRPEPSHVWIREASIGVTKLIGFATGLEVKPRFSFSIKRQQQISDRFSFGVGVGVDYRRVSIFSSISFLEQADYDKLTDDELGFLPFEEHVEALELLTEDVTFFRRKFELKKSIWYAQLTFMELDYALIKNRLAIYCNGNLAFFAKAKTQLIGSEVTPYPTPEARLLSSRNYIPKDLQLSFDFGLNYKITNSIELRLAAKRDMVALYKYDSPFFGNSYIQGNSISAGLAYVFAKEPVEKGRFKDFEKDYGVELTLGGTFSQLRNARVSVGEYIKTTPKVAIGFEGFKRMTPRLKLQTGLIYEVRGIQQRIFGFTIGSNFLTVDEHPGRMNLTTTYLSVPLKVRYEWGSKWGLYTEAGVKFSYLLFTKREIDWARRHPNDPLTTFTMDESYKNERDRLSNYDFSVLLGAGTIFRYSQNCHLSFGLAYNHGLVELGRSPTGFFPNYFNIGSSAKSQLLELKGSVIYYL